MTTLSDIVEEKKRFFDSFEDKFKSGIKCLFDSIPELKKISWSQYTPSFNDGDPCSFSVNDVYFEFDEKLIKKEDQAGDEDAPFYSDDEEEENVVGLRIGEVKENLNLSKETRSLVSAFNKEFHELNLVLEHIFGSDKEISIDREGYVKTQDYDCGY